MKVPSQLRRIRVPPSLAWLAVFGPALSYFLATRWHHAGFSTRGSSATGDLVTANVIIMTTTTDTRRGLTVCEELSTLFYMTPAECRRLYSRYQIDESTRDNSPPLLTLSQGLFRIVAGTAGPSIVSLSWREDADLGRGYLLWSDAQHPGRIWRWEVGGGPFVIGKSLHLDQAGCRSNFYRNCDTNHITKNTVSWTTGSGGITIEPPRNPDQHWASARLVVAEWGEGRIARLEENGARTPLVLTVPDVCHDNTNNNNDHQNTLTPLQRLERPWALLYTARGDLLMVDHFAECDETVLFLVQQVDRIEPLASLAESRQAHQWTSVTPPKTSQNLSSTSLTNDCFKILLKVTGNRAGEKAFTEPSFSFHIGGMAWTADGTVLYITAKQGEGVVLLKYQFDKKDTEALDELSDDDDDDDDQVVNKKRRSKHQKETATHETPGPTVAWDFSTSPDPILSSLQQPGPIAVDNKGRVFLGASTHGVLVLRVDQQLVLGGLSTRGEVPIAMTLGEDKFLYIATNTSSIMRIRVKEGPVQIPHNIK